MHKLEESNNISEERCILFEIYIFYSLSLVSPVYAYVALYFL